MEIHIYELAHTQSGKIPGDTFLATVGLLNDGVKIECYDRELKKKLEEIFSFPIIKRNPAGMESGVISHINEAVMPFTEEFFEEIVYILFKYDLYGRLVY